MNETVLVVGWVVKQGKGFHQGLVKSLSSRFEEWIEVHVLHTQLCTKRVVEIPVQSVCS